MAIDLESDVYLNTQAEPAQESSWLKIGLVAAASLVLGGIGTAWWYRKTIIRMRQAAEMGQNPQFGMSEDPPSDEM